jgi:transposase
MKDGRTHLAHQAEHAVDLETGAIVGLTVQDAGESDTTTSRETLITAAEPIETAASRAETSDERVARESIQARRTARSRSSRTARGAPLCAISNT